MAGTRDASVSSLFPALAEHACTTVNRKILLPVVTEKYTSKDIVSAKCYICNKVEFEQAIDRTSPAAKGFYVTV